MTAILPLQDQPPIRGGLRSISDPLPLEENEWRSGVHVSPALGGDTFTSGYGGGSWGSIEGGDEKPVNELEPGVDFTPGTIGTIFDCGGPGSPGTPIGDTVRQRAEALIERRSWSDLARLLHTGETYRCGDLDSNGDADETNPSLQGLAVTPAGYDDGAPGSIRGVLQGLLDGVCSTWHTDPVFHVARAWMPHFLGDIVRWDESTDTFRFGPHLVSFDCYPNVGPAGTTTAADGSEVWIYASMRPLVAFGGVEVVSARHYRQNTYQVRAEREAIAIIDPTLVSAAKALVA